MQWLNIDVRAPEIFLSRAFSADKSDTPTSEAMQRKLNS